MPGVEGVSAGVVVGLGVVLDVDVGVVVGVDVAVGVDVEVALVVAGDVVVDVFGGVVVLVTKVVRLEVTPWFASLLLPPRTGKIAATIMAMTIIEDNAMTSGFLDLGSLISRVGFSGGGGIFSGKADTARISSRALCTVDA